MDGDRSSFEAHLSAVHDPTRSEVREDVDASLLAKRAAMENGAERDLKCARRGLILSNLDREPPVEPSAAVGARALPHC